MVNWILFVAILSATLLAAALTPLFSLVRWSILLCLFLPALLLGKKGKLALLFTWIFLFPLLLPIMQTSSIADVVSFLAAGFSFSLFPYALSFYKEQEKQQLLISAFTDMMSPSFSMETLLKHLYPGMKVRTTTLLRTRHEHPFSFSGSTLALPYRKGAIVLQRKAPFTEQEIEKLSEILARAYAQERQQTYVQLKKEAAQNIAAMFQYFPEAYFLYDRKGKLLTTLIPLAWQSLNLHEPEEFVLETIVIEKGYYGLRMKKKTADEKASFREAFYYTAHEIKTALTSLLFLLDQEETDPILIQKEWHRIWNLLNQQVLTPLELKPSRISKKSIIALLEATLPQQAFLKWEGKESFTTFSTPLFTVLTNLFQNAHAYSSGEKISVSFSVDEHDLHLRIANRIRRDTTSSPTQLSHGLGLETVRRIVMDLKGELKTFQEKEQFGAEIKIPLIYTDAS